MVTIKMRKSLNTVPPCIRWGGSRIKTLDTYLKVKNYSFVVIFLNDMIRLKKFEDLTILYGGLVLYVCLYSPYGIQVGCPYYIALCQWCPRPL